MTETAKNENLLFMEAMWTSFLPVIRQVKQWIEDGRIGEVRIIEASFGAYSETDPGHRLYNPELAGGALLDIGIYPLAFANIMSTSKPAEITARSFTGETGVDETTAMLIQYENGALAQLHCSIKHTTDHRARIYGTKGMIDVPDFWRAKEASLSGDEETLTTSDDRKSAGFRFEIEEMNRLLRENLKESTMMPHRTTAQNIKLLDTCRRQIGLVYPFEK